MNPAPSTTPSLRVRALNDRSVRSDGSYVLYWMTANRRTRFNDALQRARDWARSLGKPLLVLEALRCGYEWASDRLHAFIVQGMADNAESFAKAGPWVSYRAYLEPKAGDGKGLVKSLAERACVVVGDDYPTRMLQRMAAAGARDSAVLFEAVDSCGLLPLAATDRDYPTAYAFRRFLHRALPTHLLEFPEADPLDAEMPDKLDAEKAWPADVLRRWPMADVATIAGSASGLAKALGALPIDHGVPVVAATRGGQKAGLRELDRFLGEKLLLYGEQRNEPEKEMQSNLSPWLHFGHVSAHEVVARLAKQIGWEPSDLRRGDARGQREGWWGMEASAESFMDELVTWRELGYVFCRHRPDDYDRYESLPDWARTTLAEHEGDKRERVYPLEQFEAGLTRDPLWNAAQTQLVREGRIHNYLRMLWGKKILEWTRSPREALDVMVELNNKHALDGRDPNSYSGIFWVLGRFDRAWGPERPVYGKVRYMSSDNTARKVGVKDYIRRYASDSLF